MMFGKLFAAACLACTGCATITQGTSQTLVFDIEPKSAFCSLSRKDDGELGMVSMKENTIIVGKDKDEILVECKAPGFENQTIRLSSKASNAGLTGAAFLDLGITDLITGAMWQYENEVKVRLNKAAPVADQAAAVKPF